jgi:hypothetical protein
LVVRIVKNLKGGIEMKVFFMGIIVGFILAFFFMKQKPHIKGGDNAEYIFPLKPDLEPENKEKDEDK